MCPDCPLAHSPPRLLPSLSLNTSHLLLLHPDVSPPCSLQLFMETTVFSSCSLSRVPKNLLKLYWLLPAPLSHRDEVSFLTFCRLFFFLSLFIFPSRPSHCFPFLFIFKIKEAHRNPVLEGGDKCVRFPCPATVPSEPV